MVDEFICQNCGMNSSSAGEKIAIGAGNTLTCGVCGADLEVKRPSGKDFAAIHQTHARRAFWTWVLFAAGQLVIFLDTLVPSGTCQALIGSFATCPLNVWFVVALLLVELAVAVALLYWLSFGRRSAARMGS